MAEPTVARPHNAGMNHPLPPDELRALQAQAPAAPHCACSVGAYAGWRSLPPERWPAARMQAAR